jgi:hypothetical protein
MLLLGYIFTTLGNEWRVEGFLDIQSEGKGRVNYRRLLGAPVQYALVGTR